jgi:hypothetical protein
LGFNFLLGIAKLDKILPANADGCGAFRQRTMGTVGKDDDVNTTETLFGD